MGGTSWRICLWHRISGPAMLHSIPTYRSLYLPVSDVVCSYESGSHYDKCKLLFCGIPNLHTMRDSLERLQQLAARARDDLKPYSDPNYLSNLEATQWLDHIRCAFATCDLWVATVWVHWTVQPGLRLKRRVAEGRFQELLQQRSRRKLPRH